MITSRKREVTQMHSCFQLSSMAIKNRSVRELVTGTRNSDRFTEREMALPAWAWPGKREREQVELRLWY